jgi:hypothetical protein
MYLFFFIIKSTYTFFFKFYLIIKFNKETWRCSKKIDLIVDELKVRKVFLENRV